MNVYELYVWPVKLVYENAETKASTDAASVSVQTRQMDVTVDESPLNAIFLHPHIKYHG